MDQRAVSFYRYRLSMVHAGQRQAMGPARIVYYRPD